MFTFVAQNSRSRALHQSILKCEARKAMVYCMLLLLICIDYCIYNCDSPQRVFESTSLRLQYRRMNCVWRENKSCCEISVSVKPTLWHRFSWVIKRLNRPPPADARLSALSENSWPQWPRENGNQALRKTEAIFFGTFLPTLGKLADCSKPPSAPCFELPIKSCHLTTAPPPPFCFI